MSELRKHNEPKSEAEPHNDAPAEGPVLNEALKEWVARHRQSIIEPVDPVAYREAIEGLIALGGSDPKAWAPSRRRFW